METHGTRFAVSSSCDRADLDGAGEDEDIFKGFETRQPQITREETNGGASAPSRSSSIEGTSTSDSGFASGSVAAENNVSSSCATTRREDNESKRRTSKVATQKTPSVSEGNAGRHGQPPEDPIEMTARQAKCKQVAELEAIARITVDLHSDLVPPSPILVDGKWIFRSNLLKKIKNARQPRM
ncbi:uncharacterized protein LOC142560652 isoform X4 [Dermacentor variabilis]|uniref:uncharacterized protein LOC142560652 isoform X4 n=1 Tax=Dermacentor variabilis TaxID=34621 RepID=UPI003F5C1AD6